MYKLILYDLDGTLIDTREDIVRAANFMRRETGMPPLTAEEVSQYVGQGLAHLIQKCLETDDPRKVERSSKIYRDYYAKHMLDHSRLYPRALDVLDYFKNRKQAVVTNKPDPFSTEMLKALGAGDYFFEVVAGNSKYPQKPDPAAFFGLMEKTATKPQDVLFIGDSGIDIETGRRAGVDTVVVLHGFGTENELRSARPKAIFLDFQELLTAAKKENW